MDTERQEIKIIETPEEIKERILREALFLRDTYHADPDEWITPVDYATQSDDKETRQRKTANLNSKRLNKYTHGWFSLICGSIVQPLRGLPEEDEFKSTVGALIESNWRITQDDLARIENGEQKMLEDFVKDDEFKSFCDDQQMCADVCKLGEGDLFLYTHLRQGDINAIFDYIWKFQAVQEKFGFRDGSFRNYLADKVTPLVAKLQEMKKRYTSRSADAVIAGDAILNIVIGELTKK